MWVDVGAIKRAWLAGARSSSCAHSLMAEDEVLPRPECGQRRGHGNTDAAARCTFQGVWDELGENHPNHGTGSKPETDRQKGLKHPDKDIGWYGISGSGRLVKMLQRDAFATEVARGISTKQMARPSGMLWMVIAVVMETPSSPLPRTTHRRPRLQRRNARS
jgi:hypothetical protein